MTRLSTGWARGVVLALLMALALTAQAGTRRALVIGNDRYQSVARLETARADARDLALALQGDGFEVTLRLDLGERALKEALRSFKATVQPGDEVVFFFSGHGAQFQASSYLLPVDIQGGNEDQVRDEGLALQRVLDDFDERQAGFALLIIDACRNNPFRSGHVRGLRAVELAPAMPASGQMVLFSAAAGQEALDRLDDEDHARNGVFMRVLLHAMEQPGVPLDRIVRSVRRQVMELARAAGHEQVPAVFDQTVGEFFFRPPQAVANLPPEDPLGHLLAASLAPLPAAQVERAAVRPQPAGPAQRTSARPAPTRTTAARPRPAMAANSPPARRAAHPAPPRHAAGQTTRTTVPVPPGKRSRAAHSGRSSRAFRDCQGCPRMVIIPAGRYRMGASAMHVGHTARDQVPPMVVIGEPFAMGQSAVTQGEWRAVMGSNPSFFRDCGDSCPVEQVSWEDVQEFIRRLTERTGRRYRLPSETEWEYACRGGSTYRYCGSDSLEEVGWYIDNSGPSPHPVGQKPANDFGLEDMSGNVSQWLEDCFHPDLRGAPADGTPWVEAGCSEHVVRGGAWLLGRDAGQSTSRGHRPASLRSNVLGFRLVRALD